MLLILFMCLSTINILKIMNTIIKIKFGSHNKILYCNNKVTTARHNNAYTDKFNSSHNKHNCWQTHVNIARGRHVSRTRSGICIDILFVQFLLLILYLIRCCRYSCYCTTFLFHWACFPPIIHKWQNKYNIRSAVPTEHLELFRG